MKFSTAYDTISPKPNNPGKRFAAIYERGEDGVLVQTGSVDIQEGIQKASFGIKVADLINRYNNGDIAAIPTPVNVGDVDISNLPKDVLEAHMLLKDFQNKYNSLPDNVISIYPDYQSFVSALTSGKIYEDVSKLNSKPEEVVENA